MNNRIRQVLDQISALENELHAALDEQERRMRYSIEGGRVVFEQVIEDAHLRLRKGIFSWFLSVRPRNYLTMPVIYCMILPLVLFDLFITLYQAVCFPVYEIAKVRRGDYIVLDHQLLAYLNVIEKLHCMYCSYAVGLLGYAREITARTEQYFCPIKHARKILGTHSRYEHFLDYGEADDFHDRLKEYRVELAREASQAGEPKGGSQENDQAG